MVCKHQLILFRLLSGKGRNAKKGAKGGEKKAKVTSSDLDMDMDRCKQRLVM